MVNKITQLFLLFLMGCINIISAQTHRLNSDTIFIYETVEVYDTVFVYDTIWNRNTVSELQAINPRQVTILPVDSNTNEKQAYSFLTTKTATIYQNSIIVNTVTNNDDMKKISILAITLATFNTFGQDVGFRVGWSNVLTEIHSAEKYVDELYVKSNMQYSLMGTSNSYKGFSLSTGLGVSIINADYTTLDDGTWLSPFYEEASHQLTQNYLSIPLVLQYNLLWTLKIETGFYNNFLLNKNEKAPWDEVKIYDPEWLLGFNFTIYKYFEFGANIGQYLTYYATGNGRAENPEENLSFHHIRSPQFYATLKYPFYKKQNFQKNTTPQFLLDFIEKTDFGFSLGSGVWWETSNMEFASKPISSLISIGVFAKRGFANNNLAIKTGLNYSYLLSTGAYTYGKGDNHFQLHYGLYKDDYYYSLDFEDTNKHYNNGLQSFSIPCLIYWNRSKLQPFFGINFNSIDALNQPFRNVKYSFATVAGIEYEINNTISIECSYTKNINHDYRQYAATGKEWGEWYLSIDNLMFNNQIHCSLNYTFKQKKAIEPTGQKL